MLTIKPTATGIGVELTSSVDFMRQLYELTDVILEYKTKIEDGDQGNRALMIQAFAYDIRHAFMEAGYQAAQDKPAHCSIKMIWPDAIIYLMCMRQKAAYVSLQPQNLELLDVLESELKHAMYAYDAKAAAINEHLVQPIFDLNNDLLFLLQHDLHNEYINTKSPKTAFKHLSSLMHSFFDYTGTQRQVIELETKAQAKKYKCSIRDLQSEDEYLEVKRW